MFSEWNNLWIFEISKLGDDFLFFLIVHSLSPHARSEYIYSDPLSSKPREISTGF